MKQYVYITNGTIKEDIKLLLTIRNKLKNHEISIDKNVYRLHHISYHDDLYGTHHETHSVFDSFKLPQGMSREDGFKVLSYITDFIEAKENFEECSFKSVNTLEEIINLERFGFERVEVKNPDEVIDLFTIQGRTKRFKISNYYPKYFNWYKENVTKEEIKIIYKKLGLEFKDLVLIQEKQLIKSK